MAIEYSVKTKVFLISGAASGLGAGFAASFLEQGAKHVAILDVSLAAGEATSRALNETFGDGSASFHHCDVANEEALSSAFRRVVAERERIDVVINNAGIMDDSPANYKRANDVNWQALVSLTLLAREHMRADLGGAGGTVLNIASVAALQQWPNLPIYSGAKAAVLLFSSCLGMESTYSRTLVRVLSLSFGATDTPLLRDAAGKCIDEALGREFVATHDLHEMSQSVESAVAAAVVAVQRGESGSAWLSIANKPAKDISQHLRNAYGEIGKALQ